MDNTKSVDNNKLSGEVEVLQERVKNLEDALQRMFRVLYSIEPIREKLNQSIVSILRW